MASNVLLLGSWEADRQQLAIAQRSDYGDVDDLSDDLRFQVHVSRMIRKRENQPDSEISGAAAFILVTPDEQDKLRAGRIFDRLVHTGTRRLSSRVHFVTPQAKSSVLEEHEGDDNDLFGFVTELGYDDRPTLLYVPSDGESSLSYYPKGMRTDDGSREVILKFGQVTEAEIHETLQAIYRSELCTPDNMGPIKLWADAPKGYPINQAERTVQQMIRHALVGRFLWCTILQEQPGKSGRTDLEIVDDRTGKPGTIYHHALLELKVLRSFGSTGEAYNATTVQDAIAEGVNQAHSYGTAKNSVLRMLCCYDMRTNDVGDDATFIQVKDRATTLSIRLKRWYLYRTSQDYRDATVDQHLAAANSPTITTAEATSPAFTPASSKQA
ncbi:hypothetical protein [Burkholderia vietnamiensis]|uniref:hypothetical protein n=1 Tax=Burkholderia vietnamiensis TaxID=60552 RepID=UPI000ACCF056|nr:hypothetical protein [Burkholderia vietnamiensis]